MRTTGVRSALVGLPRSGRRRIRQAIIVLFVSCGPVEETRARARKRGDFALFFAHLIVGARRREPARGVRHGRRRRVAGSPFIAAL